MSAVNRPARILCEQTTLPLETRRLALDVLLNPGFTAPVFAPCPGVTVFHDLQHKRQPENFRWFDLPFWRALLYASAHQSRHLLADSAPGARDDRHLAVELTHACSSFVYLSRSSAGLR